MTNQKQSLIKPCQKFGAILGVAPGNVPVYSSDYKTVDTKEIPNRAAFKNYIDGIFMGHKWQCVEFARRWLYLNMGCVFVDIAMAYDIFTLAEYQEIKSHKTLPLHSFKNGARRWP